MQRRLITAILLLALFAEGPVAAYSAALGAGSADNQRSCAVEAQSLTDCDRCCTPGTGASCSASCVLTVGTAMPATDMPLILRSPSAAIPDGAPILLVGHDSALILRPPIL
jgi:hypothetical protein